MKNEQSVGNEPASKLNWLLSGWAVLAGYLAMSLLVIILMMIALAIVPQWRMTVSGDYLAANIMINILSAICGGWLCARLSPNRPMSHGIALGLITLIGGMFYALNMPQEAGRASPPQWYGPVIAVMGSVAVIPGALLYVRTKPGHEEKPTVS